MHRSRSSIRIVPCSILIFFVMAVVVFLDNNSSVREQKSFTGSVQLKSMFSIPRRDSEHGNQQLCEFLLKRIETFPSIDTFMNASTTGSVEYKDLDCGYDYGTSRTGNYLTRWYLTRKIAADAGVMLSGSCRSASPLMQWLSTTHIQPDDTKLMQFTHEAKQTTYTWKDTCAVCLSNETHIRDRCVFPHGNSDAKIGFARILPTIQEDMQALAQGVQGNSPHIQFDDVAIHIRVGDIGKIASGRYGLIPFPVYFKYIPKGFEGRIGIITAPFHQSRGSRPNDPILNEAIITSACAVLQKAFPSATVSIRNDPQETHDVVFARLILAKVLLFCSPSSYCLVPALGRLANSEGGKTVLVQTPLFGPTPGWLDGLVTLSQSINHTQVNGFNYVKEPFLSSTTLQHMNVSEILVKLQHMDRS